MNQSPPMSRASRWALEHARLYRKLGYNVLPTRTDKKRPMVRFGHLWEEMAPEGWFADEGWFDTPSIQVMTGRHWRLAVIDLDGPDAIEMFPTMGPSLPWTWESSSGGGGRHLWFTLPDGLPPLPKRLLWGVWDADARDGKGAWEKRKAIEFLGDRSLVMAPPSIHPRTNRVYRFRGGCSPKELPRPAMMPRWVLDLPTTQPPRTATIETLPPVSVVRKAPERPLPSGVDRQVVLDAIPDKIAVARSWGVRIVAEEPGPTGWVDCHDFNRADIHPSARFHPEAGLFWRPGERPMSLFDLGVARGHYATWLDCCADLASIYLFTPKVKA